MPATRKRSKSSKRNKSKKSRSDRRQSTQRGPHSVTDTSFELPWHSRPEFSRFWQHYSSLMQASHTSTLLQHAAYADTAASSTAVQSRRLCSLHQGRRPFSVESPYAQFAHENSSPRLCHQHKSAARRRVASGGCHNVRLSRPKRKIDASVTRTRDRDHESGSDHDLNLQMRTGMMLDDNDDSNGLHGATTAADEQHAAAAAVSAEYLAFVEQSLRHKEEWKNRKANILKKDDVGTQMDQGDTKNNGEEEHPDSVRSKEMLQLYGGAAAARLHAMETALQLTFDRVATRHHAKLWPNIPINVMFGDTA